VTALRRVEPAARVVWPPLALCALLVVTWALVDGFGDVVYKDTAVRLFLTLIIVLGLQIFSGNSGVLSFGHIAFMAIGAYMSALLTIPPDIKKFTYLSMPSWLGSWILPAKLSPLEATLAGAGVATLFALIWINTIAGALTLVGVMLTQLEIAPVAVTNLFVLGTMAIALLALGHRGRINTAGWFLIAIDILSTSLRALHAGGIRAPGVTLFFIYPLMAGLLLGEAAGVVTAAVCAAIGLGLVLAEQHNILPDQTRFYNIFTYWWIGCFYMSLVIYLMRLATQNVNRALKRAEAELADRRKTEQHLSIALEAGAIGIWEGDLRSTRFRADERTSAVIGLPRASDGTIAFEAWRAIVHPDDLPAVTWGIQQMTEGAVPQGKGEFRLILPDGDIRHVEASSAPVRGEAGEVVSYAGTVIDITQRKRAEAERGLGEAQRRSLELSAGGRARRVVQLGR